VCPLIMTGGGGRGECATWLPDATVACDRTCGPWETTQNKMEYQQLEAKSQVHGTWTIRIELLYVG
jgi:hypothetical protein